MEGFMFSTPMIISPVDVGPRLGAVDEMLDSSIAREYFVPESEPVLEPFEGMEFESEEAARAFYSAYAAQTGFKARVSSFIRSKRDKTIISRQLVCSREGFRSTKDASNEGRTKRPRMITRVGCRAMIMVKKQSSGKWVISKCEKIHNHVLGTQGKVVMLDFDPYAREDEEMIENPLGRDSALHEGIGNGLEVVVVPPEGEPGLDPQVGMEFETEQDAQEFYKVYARRVGFRARISSYYRSKRDNSIISRLIVCSKEGFRARKDEGTELRAQRPRAITRIGCKAMIMVKKRDSGKWVVSKLVKNHNHVLTPRTESGDEHSEDDDESTDEIEKVLVANEGDSASEPYEGMEFETEEEAKIFYFAYSRRVGFNMRVSTYYRSKRDRSIISRLFVCSKEGFYVKKDVGDEGKTKRPREATRVGCKAMLMVKKNNSGKWVVSKFEKDHNHPLGSLRKLRRLRKQKHLFANAKTTKDQIELEQSEQESPISRYNKLCHEAIRYAEVGATSEDVYNVAMHALQEAVKRVAAIKNDVPVPKSGVLANEGKLDGAHTDGQVQGALHSNEHLRTKMHPSHPQTRLSQERQARRLRTCRQPSDHVSRSCPTEQQVNSFPIPGNMTSDKHLGQLLHHAD